MLEASAGYKLDLWRQTQWKQSEDAMNDALREELLAMEAEDRRMRAELMAEGVLGDGYHPRMQAVHDRNAARLTEIIAEHGWPGRSLAGDDGSHAAWFIVQHAIAHPALQRRCLLLLREAVQAGEAAKAQIAYLEDRIRYMEGQPQLYGTQYDWDENGELSPHPIEDPASVDERRRSVGLGTLAENTRRLRKDAAGERPAADWAEQQRKLQEWARSVGWRE
jgi:hypothetical protein